MKNRLKRGFTLVELLVVIAVIGVLIAIVVMAVDPLEQLARGRDAGRKAAVAQLGRAMSAYVTNQQRTTYPGATDGISAANAWQTFLETAGELTNPIQVVAVTGGRVCFGATPPPGFTQLNVCYNPTGADAVIWTVLESRSERDRSDGTAGACTATSGQTAAAGGHGFVVWTSSQGRAGLWCTGAGSVSTVPPPNATLF